MPTKRKDWEVIKQRRQEFKVPTTVTEYMAWLDEDTSCDTVEIQTETMTFGLMVDGSWYLENKK